jgi:hypothetical protein
MTWIRVLVLIFGLVEGIWMTFDGTRALIVGDYVTPSSGVHAGELGPWSHVVKAVGIPPRSTAMKLIFVAYGLAWLLITVGFAFRALGVAGDADCCLCDALVFAGGNRVRRPPDNRPHLDSSKHLT